MRLRAPPVSEKSRFQEGQAQLGIIAVLALSALVLFMLFLGLPLKFVVFSIVGSLVFVVAFVNTDIALIILIFSMLLSPEFAVGAITGREVIIRADDLFVLVAFLGWLAKMAINKELGLLKNTPLNIPIVIYIVICLLSSFLAVIERRIEFKDSFFIILKYTEYFLLYFMVSNNLKNMRQAKRFVFFMLLTCCIVCIYSLANLSGQEGRATAPFEGEGGEPNTFAGYLILMMAIIIALFFYPDSARKKVLTVWLMLPVSAAFMLTLSRSGWLSLFPMILTFVVLVRQARMPLILISLVAVMFFPVIAPKNVHKRVKETFVPWKTYRLLDSKVGVDESTAARIDSWGVGISRWLKNPIIGYGIPAGVVIDNQYTRVLNETGIVGFGVFLWILMLVLAIAWRSYKKTKGDNFSTALSLALIAGFFGLLLLSNAAAAFIIIRIMEPFWFLVAIVEALPELEREEAVA